MQKEMINQLFEIFEQAAHEIEGVECWSARELQGILGYAKWENFVKVIDKAKNLVKKLGSAFSIIFLISGK